MSATLEQPSALEQSQRFPTVWRAQVALLAQGGYYALTGLWAIFDIDSFQAVTGPKTDLWLVRTVGVLVVVISAVLLLGARKEKPSLEVAVLALGVAAGLGLVDVVIVFTRAASAVYLLDALIEFGLIAWWVRIYAPPASDEVEFPHPTSQSRV